MKRINLQIKVLIISTIIIASLFTLMILNYGFKPY